MLFWECVTVRKLSISLLTVMFRCLKQFITSEILRYCLNGRAVWQKTKRSLGERNLEIIEKHSLVYTNVHPYQKNSSSAAVSTTFPISGYRWCNPNTRACSQAKQMAVRCLISDHGMQVINFLLLCWVDNIHLYIASICTQLNSFT